MKLGCSTCTCHTRNPARNWPRCLQILAQSVLQRLCTAPHMLTLTCTCHLQDEAGWWLCKCEVQVHAEVLPRTQPASLQHTHSTTLWLDGWHICGFS